MSTPHRPVPDQPVPGPPASPGLNAVPEQPVPAPRLNWREWPAEPQRPYRPGTVTAAAVLLFITGGLAILIGIGLGVLINVADATSEERTLVLVIAGLALPIGALNLVLGVFVLKGRQWARITAIVFNAVGLALSLLDLVLTISGDTSGGGSGCTGIATSIAIIALLSGERAREYFKAMR